MKDFTIDVGKIEELQMLKDVDALGKIFAKAKSAIVQGMTVILFRTNPDGSSYKFSELTTEKDLSDYTKAVLKYLQ